MLGFNFEDRSITMRASGRWLNGGVVQLFQNGVLLDTILLAQVEWAIVALLIQKSILSMKNGVWESALVTARELADQLVEHTEVVVPDTNNVIRAIHRIRGRFSDSVLGQFLGLDDLGKRLLETVPNLGYRLSMPPIDLTFNLLDQVKVNRASLAKIFAEFLGRILQDEEIPQDFGLLPGSGRILSWEDQRLREALDLLGKSLDQPATDKEVEKLRLMIQQIRATGGIGKSHDAEEEEEE